MDCVTTPPMMGPSAGPSSGMNVEIAYDLPRSSGTQQSDSTGCVTANSALAPIPDSTRLAIIRPGVRLKPATVFHTT